MAIIAQVRSIYYYFISYLFLCSTNFLKMSMNVMINPLAVLMPRAQTLKDHFIAIVHPVLLEMAPHAPVCKILFITFCFLLILF